MKRWACVSLVRVGVFQFSLFSLYYSLFAQSSLFSPKILKLTQILGINRSYSNKNHKINKKLEIYKGLFYTYFSN